MMDQTQQQHAPVRGALHEQLQALAQANSSGSGVSRALTPLKRSRADVQQRISDDLARNSCEMPVDEVVDNMRSQKRFLSEVGPRGRQRCMCTCWINSIVWTKIRVIPSTPGSMTTACLPCSRWRQTSAG